MRRWAGYRLDSPHHPLRNFYLSGLGHEDTAGPRRICAFDPFLWSDDYVTVTARSGWGHYSDPDKSLSLSELRV